MGYYLGISENYISLLCNQFGIKSRAFLYCIDYQNIKKMEIRSCFKDILQSITIKSVMPKGLNPVSIKLENSPAADPGGTILDA